MEHLNVDLLLAVLIGVLFAFGGLLIYANKTDCIEEKSKPESFSWDYFCYFSAMFDKIHSCRKRGDVDKMKRLINELDERRVLIYLMNKHEHVQLMKRNRTFKILVESFGEEYQVFRKLSNDLEFLLMVIKKHEEKYK